MNSICVCQNNIICPDCLNNPEYMINVYNDKMNNYITEIPNSHYMLEITKNCGYSAFLTIKKDRPLSKLFQKISIMFHVPINSLYVCSSVEPINKMVIPYNANVSLRDYICANVSHFRPIYPAHLPVVYKIYFDDGYYHNHNHNHTHNHSNMVIDSALNNSV